ncbi:MAG: cell division protein FtsQ/DivIB [Pseudomonadota bacterium]
MRSLTRQADAQNAPRDPAPSRLGYRFQRMMLTPGFRALVRVGVPLLLILSIVGSWYSHAANRQALAQWVDTTKQSFQERPQFLVQSRTLTGGDLAVQAVVAEVLPAAFPVSSFDLDLERIRADVEGLPQVKSASVRVGADATLEVQITPRVPVALWRDGTVLRLIDADGTQSGVIAARVDRPDLPLIAGDGAEAQLTQALALFEAAAPLQDRVRGLVRMGERRWDMVLDRDQRLLLPAEDPLRALQRVIVLDDAQELLARDVAVVDMRNANRPTLRMNEAAAAALRRVTTTPTDNGAGN